MIPCGFIKRLQSCLSIFSPSSLLIFSPNSSGSALSHFSCFFLITCICFPLKPHPHCVVPLYCPGFCLFYIVYSYLKIFAGERDHVTSVFWVCVTPLNIVFFVCFLYSCTYLPISCFVFFLQLNSIPLCIYIPHFHYPFIY